MGGAQAASSGEGEDEGRGLGWRWRWGVRVRGEVKVVPTVVRVCVEAERVGLGCDDGECIEVARMGMRSVSGRRHPQGAHAWYGCLSSALFGQPFMKLSLPSK